MNRTRLFQIIACFAAVFVLGGVCGWLLKPAPPTGAIELSSDRVLSSLDSRLQLTAEQKQKLAPVLAEWERALPPVGQGPRSKRHQLFDHYAPLVREVLTTNQHAAYDKMVEEYQKKAAR